jgi:hypothetical protein
VRKINEVYVRRDSGLDKKNESDGKTQCIKKAIEIPNVPKLDSRHTKTYLETFHVAIHADTTVPFGFLVSNWGIKQHTVQ